MLLEIAIVGVIASLIMQGIKKWAKTSGWKSKVATVLVSIVLGGAYYFLKGTNVWESMLGVLASASTVYAFFVPKN